MDKPTLHHDDGYTFVELMTAIVVIGILATVAISVFLGQRAKAHGATAVSDLRNAATAEESAFVTAGAYTQSLSALTDEGFRKSSDTRLGVAVSAAGYCEVGVNNGTYWWYDSAAGGLQRATTTSLVAPASATGACAASAPTAVS